MKVEIYAKSWCPYCQRALALLDQLAVDYVHHDVTQNRSLEKQMIQRAGKTSVPQIFINDQHIGGSDDLFALNRSGELSTLLAQDAHNNKAYA